MSGFVQLMEIKTSRIDEVNALVRKMAEERGDRFLARRAVHAADRDRAGHYFAIVEFDSYEEAMKNSNDPATGEFAGQLRLLLDEPPTFYNLDVLEDYRK
ncbi:MAG: hypothetical protein ACLPUG_09710 [Acidimicrobiales bacterium]|jgi:hypothetical protein